MSKQEIKPNLIKLVTSSFRGSVSTGAVQGPRASSRVGCRMRPDQGRLPKNQLIRSLPLRAKVLTRRIFSKT
jgi:hypothetical protein